MTARATTYHHGDLRAALVRVAVELARESGPDGVVLRETARRVGVSHNAAYRHFADREELLTEVARAGLAQLAEAMRLRQADHEATDDPADPERRARRRLRALGESYVAFAIDEPGLFRVAFQALAHPRPEDAAPFLMLGEALDELVDVGVLTAEQKPGAEMMAWAAVHGFALLVLDGPLRLLSESDRDATRDAMLDAVDAGL